MVTIRSVSGIKLERMFTAGPAGVAEGRKPATIEETAQMTFEERIARITERHEALA